MIPLSMVFRWVVYREWKSLQVCEKEEASSRSSAEQRMANCNSLGMLVKDKDMVNRRSSVIGECDAGFWSAKDWLWRV